MGSIVSPNPSELARKLTTPRGKKPEKAADSWGPTQTRFSCPCATADQTLGIVSCGRTPTPPPQHRHPTVAGRATCSSGHVSKEDYTFDTPLNSYPTFLGN